MRRSVPNSLKRKTKMNKKKVLIIAAAVSAALLLGGIFLLTKDSVCQRSTEKEIKPYMPSPKILSALDDISTPETSTEEATVSGLTVTSDNPVTPSSELPSELRQQLIDNAAELKNAYPDSLGWLYIPDTVISYPIMQSDDNEFYLSHAFDGSSLKAGSIFLDYRCENRLMNPINVLYGHNMKNGSMFAQVTSYTTDSFFEAHRYGWLSTPETVYRIDFFACSIVRSDDRLYNGDSPISEWIPHIYDSAVVSRGMSYSGNDRFISLSTCSYEFENARTVLTGRLVSTEEVDTIENDDN